MAKVRLLAETSNTSVKDRNEPVPTPIKDKEDCLRRISHQDSQRATEPH